MTVAYDEWVLSYIDSQQSMLEQNSNSFPGVYSIIPVSLCIDNQKYLPIRPQKVATENTIRQENENTMQFYTTFRQLM